MSRKSRWVLVKKGSITNIWKSESGDHIKSEKIKKLSGDNHVQAVQELQESISVNKEGIQEDINSETED